MMTNDILVPTYQMRWKVGRRGQIFTAGNNISPDSCWVVTTSEFLLPYVAFPLKNLVLTSTTGGILMLGMFRPG